MSLAEIIERNRKIAACSWWPRFAYHYTDVTNAVNIVTEGFLYSRIEANKLGIMKNDNASRQVIDMTETAAKSSVRFYFRPMTPTQYYNEGYKHPLLRYDRDLNANVPVPVFFLFDLEELLSMPQTLFSETGQAGHGAPTMRGEDAFGRLDFKKIYSAGFCEHEVLQYRHAEIVHPNAFPLDAGLRYIMCRNDVEKLTLMNLLKVYDPALVNRYSPVIKVCPSDMFENNGLFITSIANQTESIRFTFSDSRSKINFTKSAMGRNRVGALMPVNMRIRFEWFNETGRIIYSIEPTYQIDYNGSTLELTNVPQVSDAQLLRLKIYFEDCFVCQSDYPLIKSELI